MIRKVGSEGSEEFSMNSRGNKSSPNKLSQKVRIASKVIQQTQSQTKYVLRGHINPNSQDPDYLKELKKQY